MKIKFSLLILLFFSSIASASVELKYQPAQILGLWNFVSSIADLGRRQSTILQNLYQTSKYSKDKKNQQALVDLKSIYDSQFGKSYHFADYPETRGEMGWDIARHFDYQAAQSKDLKEFKTRTAQTLAPSEHLKLFQILEKLSPIYDDLVWNPNKLKLDAYGEKLLTTWNSANLSKLFVSTLAFYRSDWSFNSTVTIHAMPIPAAKGHTRATVIRDAVVLECLLDEEDIAGRVGVVFHELSHAAYEAQPAKVQKSLNEWFQSHPSKFRNLAYNLLNEGLATALGNGLAYKTITGKEDPEDWYSVTEINEGAKAASELVRSYVLKAKPIDKDFVNKWIAVYEHKFPNALNLLEVRLREAVLLTDNEVLRTQDARSILKKSFRISSMFSGSPINEPESLEVFAEAGPEATIVLVFKNKNQNQVADAVKKAPELKSGLELLKNKSSKVVGYISNNRPILLFDVANREQFEELVHRLGEISVFPSQPTVMAEL